MNTDWRKDFVFPEHPLSIAGLERMRKRMSINRVWAWNMKNEVSDTVWSYVLFQQQRGHVAGMISG